MSPGIERPYQQREVLVILGKRRQIGGAVLQLEIRVADARQVEDFLFFQSHHLGFALLQEIVREPCEGKAYAGKIHVVQAGNILPAGGVGLLFLVPESPFGILAVPFGFVAFVGEYAQKDHKPYKNNRKHDKFIPF